MHERLPEAWGCCMFDATSYGLQVAAVTGADAWWSNSGLMTKRGVTRGTTISRLDTAGGSCSATRGSWHRY